mmetsp:Transcript_8301/g.9520  ORF Transcript_8301/g.9520 Transcript_8301/m.9520 type:complete len:97 (+) Transcript_8301:47-337(+)
MRKDTPARQFAYGSCITQVGILLTGFLGCRKFHKTLLLALKACPWLWLSMDAVTLLAEHRFSLRLNCSCGINQIQYSAYGWPSRVVLDTCRGLRQS